MTVIDDVPARTSMICGARRSGLRCGEECMGCSSGDRTGHGGRGAGRRAPPQPPPPHGARRAPWPRLRRAGEGSSGEAIGSAIHTREILVGGGATGPARRCCAGHRRAPCPFQKLTEQAPTTDGCRRSTPRAPGLGLGLSAARPCARASTGRAAATHRRHAVCSGRAPDRSGAHQLWKWRRRWRCNGPTATAPFHPG